MPKLRVFISSTCYDLGVVRSELRPFIVGLGHDPIMSDYSDILYDPNSHTHESCLREIPNCDVLVVIVGGRFGGKAIPEVLKSFTAKKLDDKSRKDFDKSLLDKSSITQAEVYRAINLGIPIFTFVDEKVLHDHLTYETNKEQKKIINKIVFPSIQKQETSTYIFEFINFIRSLKNNNAIFPFSSLDGIKNNLRSQWSQHFQQLLADQRNRNRDENRLRDFSESLEDLKAIILTTIESKDLKIVGRGVIKFRRLMDFIFACSMNPFKDLLLSDISWDELLEGIGISKIEPTKSMRFSRRTAIIRTDDSFLTSRFSLISISELQNHWEAFKEIGEDNRRAIVDSLYENRDERFNSYRPMDEKYADFLENQDSTFNEDEDL